MTARAAFVALLAFGCSEATTSTLGTRPMKANMSVSASIASRSATQVLLLAFYSATPLDSSGFAGNVGAAGYLGAPQLIDLTSASSQSVPMSIDLAPCLSNLKVSRGADTCPYVYVEAFLLTGQNTIDPNAALGGKNLLDADLVGPFSVSSNGTATTPRALVLHEVEDITVLPSLLSLSVGQTSPLAATIVDIFNNVVAGRTVTWSSANNIIATVTPSGQVTGLAPGSTTVTASAGGRSKSVAVSVSLPVQPARLVLSATSAAFVATLSSIVNITPISATITVSSSGGAASPIALNPLTITYGTTGVNWLSVSLNTTTTPASVSIAPTNLANLLIGTYSATVTVRPTNTAIASASVLVTLTATTSSTGSITVLNSGRP